MAPLPAFRLGEDSENGEGHQLARSLRWRYDDRSADALPKEGDGFVNEYIVDIERVDGFGSNNPFATLATPLQPRISSVA